MKIKTLGRSVEKDGVKDIWTLELPVLMFFSAPTFPNALKNMAIFVTDLVQAEKKPRFVKSQELYQGYKVEE